MALHNPRHKEHVQLLLFISNSNDNSCHSSHLKFVHNKAIPRLIYSQTEELMKRNEQYCVYCRTASQLCLHLEQKLWRAEGLNCQEIILQISKCQVF